MKIIKLSSQKQVESDTCGSILEVINNKNFPFGIVVSVDISSTDAHYYKKAKKCYWMLKGWIELVIESKVETKDFY